MKYLIIYYRMWDEGPQIKWFDNILNAEIYALEAQEPLYECREITEFSEEAKAILKGRQAGKLFRKNEHFYDEKQERDAKEYQLYLSLKNKYEQ